MMREHQFTINEQTYTLRFTFNAIVELEENLKMPITKLVSEDNFGIKEMRAILWAGLRSRHKLSLEEVGNLIDDYDGTLEELLSKAIELITKALKV